MLLTARIGSSLLATWAGAGQLHLLNQSGAELLRLFGENDGDEEPLIALLVERCGYSEHRARDDVQTFVRIWRDAGLIVSRPPVARQQEAWVIPSPNPKALPKNVIAANIGGDAAAISVGPPEIRAQILTTLASLVDPDARDYRHLLELTGAANDWTLHLNGEVFGHGQSVDSAIVSVLSLLMDLAARAEDRLLVVHGAGLVGADGRAILLIAPGGSGKTTLSAALNATGFDLLNDDVVPVNFDGSLMRLQSPICVKSGSWPILAGMRPEIEALPVTQRYGEPVKYLPPLTHGPQRAAALDSLIFPHYQSDRAPCCVRLTPEDALQRIVEAECLVKDLTQEKLEMLARWIESVPSYSLVYPDLPGALGLVRSVVGDGQ